MYSISLRLTNFVQDRKGPWWYKCLSFAIQILRTQGPKTEKLKLLMNPSRTSGSLHYEGVSIHSVQFQHCAAYGSEGWKQANCQISFACSVCYTYLPSQVDILCSHLQAHRLQRNLLPLRSPAWIINRMIFTVWFVISVVGYF